jgi:hypothetical protein
MSSTVSLTNQEIKEFEKLWKKIQPKNDDYESPISKMKERAFPDANNTIDTERCPAPLRACIPKDGFLCPPPYYANYPYIREKKTGALCYPNLNTAAMQNELREEKKARARKAIVDLIKVLAAIEDDDATPAMCNVVNNMSSKPPQLRQAYCESLTNKTGKVCQYDGAQCFPVGGKPSAAGVAGPPLAGPPLAGPPLAGPPLAGPPLAGPPLAGPPLAGPPLAGPSAAAAAALASGERETLQFVDQTFQLTRAQRDLLLSNEISNYAQNSRMGAISGLSKKSIPLWIGIARQIENGQITNLAEIDAAVQNPNFVATAAAASPPQQQVVPTGQQQVPQTSQQAGSKPPDLTQEQWNVIAKNNMSVEKWNSLKPATKALLKKGSGL